MSNATLSNTNNLWEQLLNGTADDPGLFEHLGELRTRIITSVVTLIATITLAWFVTLPVIEWLKTLAPADIRGALMFVQITPGEVMLVSVKLSFIIGLIAASPMLLYQTLVFVLPGLTGHEKRPVLLTVAFGTGLFIFGLWFAAQFAVPPALSCLVGYGQAVAQSQISIASYVDFCVMLMAVTGVLFELPLVLMLLATLNLVTSKRLIQEWRMAVVIIAVAAAILTPSQDPLTMIIVGAAMGVLYAASLILLMLMGK